MKKLILLLFLFTFSFLPSYSEISISTEINSAIAQEKVVYVTNTGKKYHNGGCRYLSKSKIKTTLSKAIKNNYDACKVCKP